MINWIGSTGERHGTQESGPGKHVNGGILEAREQFGDRIMCSTVTVSTAIEAKFVSSLGNRNS